MHSEYPIHDLYIKPIRTKYDRGVTSWMPLRDDDHLLRRFGQVEVVRMEPTAPPICRLREVADDLWALIDGSAELRFKDLRAVSPSQGGKFSLHVHESTLALVPFGVGFGIGALEEGAILIRMSTHEDGTHPADRTLRWEDLE
jgi:dTDP-4-dehydrorhamnose 3,5-epimerase